MLRLQATWQVGKPYSYSLWSGWPIYGLWWFPYLAWIRFFIWRSKMFYLCDMANLWVKEEKWYGRLNPLCLFWTMLEKGNKRKINSLHLVMLVLGGTLLSVNQRSRVQISTVFKWCRVGFRVDSPSWKKRSK